MKQALTVKKQVIRLGLLSSLGVLTIISSLWFTGQLRLVEQFKLPAGAVIALPASPHSPESVRVAAGATVFRFGARGSDVFYNSDGRTGYKGRTGYSWGTHQFDALRAQGTQYHWWLQLGTHTVVGS